MMPAANIPLVVRNGSCTAIAFAVGRKYMHAVAMGQPIHLVAIPITQEKAWAPLERNGKPYLVRRAARRYLKSEISKTERAVKVLRALARGETAIRP